MIELLALLAQAMPVPVDAMISSTAVVGIIGAITTLVVGVIGKLKVDAAKSQTNDVTLKKPVPLIETREKPQLVTRDDLEAHLKRIDNNMRAAKDDNEAALVRFANSHAACKAFQDTQHASNQKRLDDQVKALARMEGMVASVQHTVNTLLDLALNKKPNPRQ
jgi:hypothetical protein